jgi:hypothetical protein
MTRSTKNNSSSDDTSPPLAAIEYQLTSINTVVQEISIRMVNQDSRLDKHDSQFKDTAALLTQLVTDMKKNQVDHTMSSSKYQSPPPQTEPPPTSIPYQHPHARTQDGHRPPFLHQEFARRDED